MLRAGAAKVNITPYLGCPMAGYGRREHGSESIHDELHAAALVLDDGERTLAIVTTDLIGISRALSGAVRARVRERLGVPEEHVLICGSHTHFGPEIRAFRVRPDDPISDVHKAYWSVLEEKLAGAVQRAHRNLRPARLGAGSENAKGLAYNRRLVRKDGSVRTVYVLPLPEDEELSFGPTDPELGLLKVEAADGGAQIASLLNYACHPVTSADRLYEISADYPGYALELVERERGGVALFALGCAGNQVPIRRRDEMPRKIGVALGGAALKALPFIETSGAIKLRAARREIELPIRDLQAKSELEFTRKIFQHLDGQKTLRAEVQAIWIGEHPLIGLPGEIFVESGRAIKRELAASPVFVFSMSNDSLGYFPTRGAYPAEGYEPTASPFVPGAAERIVEEACALARSLR